MRSYTYWLMALCLCVVVNIHAQTLKTYSGKFNGGYAVYTYKDNPEGGRIYEGKFVYTAGNYQASGNFKNNMRDGLWIYKDAENILKVNYKDGVRDGVFSYQGIAGKVNLTFKNNKIVGKVNFEGEFSWPVEAYVLIVRGKLTGQCDETGYADGTWTVDATQYNGKIYRVTYKNGYFIKSSEEDITTGDIETYEMSIAYNAVEGADKKSLERFIDRGLIPFDVNYSITKRGTPSDEAEKSEDEICTLAEVMPSYPGGATEAMKYISTHIIYPSSAKSNGIQGRVMVRFIVNKDGTISNAEVLRGINEELDAEAIRVITSMPKWIPGKINGENVNVQYTLPVLFKL